MYKAVQIAEISLIGVEKEKGIETCGACLK
jgi:hypothetical protein